MRSAHRIVVVVFGLLSSAPAQHVEQLLDCSDFARRFDGGEMLVRGDSAPERFAAIMHRLWQNEPCGTAGRDSWIGTDARTRMLAHCTPYQRAFVNSAHAQLQSEHPVCARLQFSVVTYPAAMVRAQRLEVNAFGPADETTFGEFVRKAVKWNGVLQNLPEVIARPLAPFVAERRGVQEARSETGVGMLRVRGEMLPVRAGEIVLGVQLVRGPVADDCTMVPWRAMRLVAGQSALAVALDGELAAVVFVRCLEVASGSPPQQKTGRWILP